MLLWFRNSIQAGTNFLIARYFGTTSAIATAGTGWQPGQTAAGNYSLLKGGTNQVQATFGTTPLPNTSPSNAAGDVLVSEIPFTGTFSAGTWSLAMGVIAASSTVTGGRLRCRVWRMTAQDGSGTNTEITSGAVVFTTATALTTTTQQNLTGSFSPGAVTLTNEYLAFQFAWEITVASALNGASVRLRTDTTNSAFTLPSFKFNMTGTTTLDLTVAGSLKGYGRLQGATTLTLGVTSTLHGYGALQGVFGAGLDTGGDLRGYGGLAGAFGANLAMSGDLGGYGALSGATSLSLSLAGSVKAIGELAGAFSTDLSVAGDAVGYGALSGSFELDLVMQSSLSGVAELTGTTSMDLSTTGHLTGLGRLQGSTSVCRLDVVGALGGYGKLAGSTSFSLGLAGVMRGDGELNGSFHIRFDVRGDLGVEGAEKTAVPKPLSGGSRVLGARGGAPTPGLRPVNVLATPATSNVANISISSKKRG